MTFSPGHDDFQHVNPRGLFLSYWKLMRYPQFVKKTHNGSSVISMGTPSNDTLVLRYIQFSVVLISSLVRCPPVSLLHPLWSSGCPITHSSSGRENSERIWRLLCVSSIVSLSTPITRRVIMSIVKKVIVQGLGNAKKN